MKAVLCEQFGLPETLQFKETPIPTYLENQVLIEVKLCSVNFPDVLIIQNKYQFKPTLPFAPGGEIAGTIIAIGNSVKHVQIGDRVIALCGWGGFAEVVAADEKRVFRIPEGLDWITAASTLYNFGTSLHALKDRAQLQKNETILILGAAGGVGIAAITLAKTMGATVIAAASTKEKLALCKEKGADFVINYSNENLRERIKEITNNKGVDVVFDPIGSNLSEQALRSIAWKGRYLVVGFASGHIPQLPFNLVLLKGCSVLGVFWGSFSEKEASNNLENLLEINILIQKGSISHHIHHIYPLHEAAKALRDLMDRKVIGKAIISIK